MTYKDQDHGTTELVIDDERDGSFTFITSFVRQDAATVKLECRISATDMTDVRRELDNTVVSLDAPRRVNLFQCDGCGRMKLYHPHAHQGPDGKCNGTIHTYSYLLHGEVVTNGG